MRNRHFFQPSTHMLKTITLTLPGRDALSPITLTELPALVADRYARVALIAADAPADSGVIGLAFAHLGAVRALGEASLPLLAPFVQTDRQPADWRNVMPLQQAALLLHAGFITTRQPIEYPVSMVAAGAQAGLGDEAVNFCSPAIAAVLHSGRASYRDLETVLSTEDAFNIGELLNVEAIREWRAHTTQRTNP